MQPVLHTSSVSSREGAEDDEASDMPVGTGGPYGMFIRPCRHPRRQ